jgi:hypothetical protein
MKRLIEGAVKLPVRLIPHFKREFLLPAAAFVLFLVAARGFSGTEMGGFDYRVVGMAAAVRNFDISGFILKVTALLFFIIPLSVVSVWLIFSLLARGKAGGAYGKCVKFLAFISALLLSCAAVNLFRANFGAIETAETDNSVDFALLTVFAVQCCCLIYAFFFAGKRGGGDFSDFVLCLFLALSLITAAVFVKFIFYLRGTAAINEFLDGGKSFFDNGNMLFEKDAVSDNLIYGPVYTAMTFALFSAVRALKLKFTSGRIFTALLPLAAAPLCVTFMSELCNILNRHGVFANSKMTYTLLIYLAAVCACAGLFFLKKAPGKSKLTALYASLTLFGFIALMSQAQMTVRVGAEFFESANHGLSVFQLFEYGKIPVVETYDTHMLSGQIFTYLYALLNNDFSVAVVGPYEVYTYFLAIGGLYALFSAAFGRTKAAFIVLFFPLFIPQSVLWVTIGFLLIPPAIGVMREPTKRNAFWYLTVAVLLALYKLDTFVMFFAGTAAVLTCYFIKSALKKQFAGVKNFLLSAGIFALALIVLWCVLCGIAGVNPFTRMMEFIHLSMFSNPNWAYGTFGDTGRASFALFYIVIPIVCTGTMLYLLYRALIAKRINNKLFIIASVLFVAFAANFSRGLVRHSLAESYTVFILGTALPFLAVSVAALTLKNGAGRACIALLCASVAVMGVFNGAVPDNASVFNTGLSSYAHFSGYRTYDGVQERVVLDDDVLERQKLLRGVFDYFMEPDETYMSLQAESLSYYLAGRENPVYVNQSPWMLSDEYTKLQFVRQVDARRDKVAFAFVPKAKVLDAINDRIRFYPLYEYLYMNFTAVVEFGGGNWLLYCRNEKLPAIAARLAAPLPADCAPTDVSDDAFGTSVGYLPYLWANYDKIPMGKRQRQLTVLSESSAYAAPGGVAFNTAGVDKRTGNYLYFDVSFNSDNGAETSIGMHLTLPNGVNDYVYFTVKAGRHRYLIRVSSLEKWYMFDDFRLSFDMPENAAVNEVAVYKGDTLY